ncbi:Crp/Fnr family transcriptional regulator [Raoultibacter timonensis]|uniref:Crp/Fnr family transcriptional regulator n=1 Tax=Raoultibacter timonensis TaxID=1907662 RepID=UPI000C8660F3|nr:Crp/Fnr family transcriptional regulator [Raoultibacter timonensis]
MGAHFSSLFYDAPPVPQSILLVGDEREFAPGEMLVEHNTSIGGCYYIIEGLVFAVDFTENGEKVFGLIVDKETLLGETSLLLGIPFPTGFQAQIKTRALFISAADFSDLFERDKEVSQYAARVAARKMLSIKKLYSNRKNESVVWRIGDTILELSYRYGKDFEGGKLIAFPLSHQLLADFVNANRITVTKCMRSLKNQGLIRRINNAYNVPDVKRLEAYKKDQAVSNQNTL